MLQGWLLAALLNPPRLFNLFFLWGFLSSFLSWVITGQGRGEIETVILEARMRDVRIPFAVPAPRGNAFTHFQPIAEPIPDADCNQPVLKSATWPQVKDAADLFLQISGSLDMPRIHVCPCLQSKPPS